MIFDCLDDEDISNRQQALDLASVVVSSDILESVVNHLLSQLRNANDAESPSAVSPEPSDDGSGAAPPRTSANRHFVLPNYYRAELLHRILNMCSRDTYAHIVDFEWYIDVLVQLVKFIPPQNISSGRVAGRKDNSDIGTRIGIELLNVAVRVKAVRAEATQAAESLLLIDNRTILFPPHSTASINILENVAFIVGEYAEYLNTPERTLTSLTHASNLQMPANVLSSYLQAIPKVFTAMTLDENQHWDAGRRGEISLALNRIVSFLEALSSNPNFDVQERAIEFLELLRLTGEAVSAQQHEDTEMPLLLSSIIPGLFSGLNLNPVAAEAQEKVPLPEGLDLDQPLKPHLTQILKDAELHWSATTDDQGEFYNFYYVPEKPKKAIYNDYSVDQTPFSNTYTTPINSPTESKEAKARRALERSERARDDPFYIAPDDNSGTSTPFAQVLQSSNGEGLDIDSIPVMPVEIDSKELRAKSKKKKTRKPKTIDIMGDETLEVEGGGNTSQQEGGGVRQSSRQKKPKALFQDNEDSFSALQFDADPNTTNIEELRRRAEEEAQMAKALAELQRKRLEMQRENERVQLSAEVPAEGILVEPAKKKKKKKSKEAGEKTKTKTKTKKKKSSSKKEDGDAPPVQGENTEEK